jgi:PIN domain nuclease of toxin-antitoxin system
MDYILDTHVLLWSMFESNKLSQSVQEILVDRKFRRFISISSAWEIAIKNRIGKLPLPNGLADVFSIVEKRGYGVLGIDQKHIEIYTPSHFYIVTHSMELSLQPHFWKI